jgi:L-lactate dehydrogenase complex protein LldG
MSAAREAIFARLKEQIGRTATEQAAAERAVAERIAARRPNIIPERGQLDRQGRIELFEQMASAVQTTVRRVEELNEVPAAVSRYLREHNLPQKLVMAPHPVLDRAQWSSQPLLRVRRGGAEPSDEVGLTIAAAGIAETGTLMLCSDATAPTLLAYLPDTCCVVLLADDIEGAYEQAWARLRANLGAPPRSVNFVTGPSRTGDIAQKIELGAHGPRRLFVAIVDRAPPLDA